MRTAIDPRAAGTRPGPRARCGVREAGFAVVNPEQMDLDEQLALVADAAVIAGSSGSALHLSAFAPASTRVLEVGDLRSPERPMPMQLVIDAVRGHEHHFVRGDQSVGEVAAEVDAALA